MTRVSWLRVAAIFAPIGRFVINGLALVGRVTLFAFRALIRSLLPPYYPGRLGEQLMQIGWLSLPVVGLTAIFTGAALAQQIYTGGSRFNAQSTVPARQNGQSAGSSARRTCRISGSASIGTR